MHSRQTATPEGRQDGGADQRAAERLRTEKKKDGLGLLDGSSSFPSPVSNEWRAKGDKKMASMRAVPMQVFTVHIYDRGTDSAQIIATIKVTASDRREAYRQAHHYVDSLMVRVLAGDGQ